MKFNLRLLYLYLFSFVGLLVVIIGSIRMVNLGFKTVIFKDADKYEAYPIKIEGEVVDEQKMLEQQARDVVRQRQREFSESLAFILVGLPVYLYHWKTIQKEDGKR